MNEPNEAELKLASTIAIMSVNGHRVDFEQRVAALLAARRDEGELAQLLRSAAEANHVSRFVHNQYGQDGHRDRRFDDCIHPHCVKIRAALAQHEKG